MRRVVLTVLVVLAALPVAVAPPAVAAPPRSPQEVSDEQAFLDLLNQSRVDQGLTPLKMAVALREDARDHSDRMAVEQRIFHDDPDTYADADRASDCWSFVGENVGFGDVTPSAIHAAFMNSTPHRTNILKPDYGYVGIGVERKPDDTIWITQRFMKLRADCPALETDPPSEPPPVTPGVRAAYVDGCGAMFLSPGGAAFEDALPCNNAADVALTDNRIGVVTPCGSMYTKDGSSAWVRQLPCNNAADVALTGNRIGVATPCGSMYTKDGSSAWVRQLPCNNAADVALTGNRIGVATPCGSMYTKDGSSAWVRQLPCNNAADLALAGSRVGVVTPCGSLYTRTTASWQSQLPCDGAEHLALTGSTIAAVTGCASLDVKVGSGAFERVVPCDTASAVALPS